MLPHLAAAVILGTSLVLGSAISRKLKRDDTLPTVALNYSTVQAASSASNGAGTYYSFKNIRYAAPPVGDLRWAAPQDPEVEMIVNNGTWSTEGTGGCSTAEDCLFLDVYVPETALNGGQKLPVLFWNYGGGWVGGNKDVSPGGLFNVSNNGLIIVAYNYRRNGGVSNVAIWDAHKAMEWTYQYISRFGGDPEQITNWGFSAGASQVTFGGHAWTPRFKRAMINSPGWVPDAGHAGAERYLQNVTELVDCPWNDAATMSCLRNVSFATLLAASNNITDTYSYQMQPRPDGVVLPDTSEYLLSIGQFHKNVTVMIGHSSNESTPTLSASLSSEDELRAELKTIFPTISTWAVDQAIALYPLLPATLAYGNVTYNYISNLGSAGHGSEQSYFWYDASPSDSSSSSSGTAMSGASSTSNQTNTAAAASSSSSGYSSSSSGSGFVGNTGGSTGSTSTSANEAWLAKQMQEWIISFVTTGDPNELFGSNAASTNQNGTTINYWPQYGANSSVVAFGDSGFSIVGDELDNEQVTWWNKALWY
ncbi:uncharacterized protein IL334_005769 [Kwoniella shivajii]|uniref:Carboxylesterase type B domain-containing protein n=1 Tax=Kwoniella shivajii TaxID=564305 RepID=A0ABZ1D5L1_9TREE|nr:hypothetical protein IL334_005769 [Kwoniella shivajii]